MSPALRRGAPSHKHCHALSKDATPDLLLVGSGNPSYRDQAHATAHPTCPCHCLVTLASRSPGRSAPCSPQEKNATVMVDVLEQQKPDDEAGLNPRPALVAIERRDLAIDPVPVDLAGELYQLMALLMICSSRARNRSPSPVVCGFLGRIAALRSMRRPNHDSRSKGIPKTKFASFRGFNTRKLAISKPANPPKIDSRSTPSAVFHGRLLSARLRVRFDRFVRLERSPVEMHSAPRPASVRPPPWQHCDRWARKTAISLGLAALINMHLPHPRAPDGPGSSSDITRAVNRYREKRLEAVTCQTRSRATPEARSSRRHPGRRRC
jgi:hypothetical protein